MTRVFPRKRRVYILMVDPAGCGCTDCIMHESVPADRLSEKEKDFIADGQWLDGRDDTSVGIGPDILIDRTGYTEQEWDDILA